MNTTNQESKADRKQKIRARVLSMLSMALVMITFVFLFGGAHPSDELRITSALVSIVGFVILNIPSVIYLNRKFDVYTAFLLFLRLSFAIALYYYILSNSFETSG